MRYLPLVVVVILLTTTVGAGVVPPSVEGGEQRTSAVDATSSSAAQLDDEGDANMTNVLAIPASDLDRSELRRHHADLGPASEFDTDGTSDQLVTRALERDLESMDDTDREARLTEELDAIEDEIDELESREQRAIGEFNDGETTPREFVIELAAIHLDADALRDRTELLEAEADSFDSEALSKSRFDTVEYDLRMLEGPVRGHAVDVLRAEHPSDRIMIETSNDAVSLTAIDDGEYIREVHRKGTRGDGDGEMTGDRAVELVEQQYPILWERRTSWSANGPGSLMLVDVNFDRGGFKAFYDGPSERNFIEHQELPLDTVTTGETVTKEQDGLNVSAEQTYAGGPLRLTVTDTETNEPVNATITVGERGEDSQTVGTTGDEGRLWTLSPRDSFTITVLGEGNDAAFVDVTPPAPEDVTPGA
ncbi:MAG: DUF7096 domain-containing protein [Halohasta sp.]